MLELGLDAGGVPRFLLDLREGELGRDVREALMEPPARALHRNYLPPRTERWSHHSQAILPRQFDGWCLVLPGEGAPRDPIISIVGTSERRRMRSRELVDKWMEASRAARYAAVLELIPIDVRVSRYGTKPLKEDFGHVRSDADLKVDAARRDPRDRGDRIHAWMRNHIDLTFDSTGGKPMRRRGYELTSPQKVTMGAGACFGMPICVPEWHFVPIRHESWLTAVVCG